MNFFKQKQAIFFIANHIPKLLFRFFESLKLFVPFLNNFPPVYLLRHRSSHGAIFRLNLTWPK